MGVLLPKFANRALALAGHGSMQRGRGYHGLHASYWRRVALCAVRSVEAHYHTTIFDMKSTLEERIKRADDISKAYKHFRLEVAKSAEHSKTSRPISDKLLAQLEADGGLAGLWGQVDAITKRA